MMIGCTNNYARRDNVQKVQVWTATEVKEWSAITATTSNGHIQQRINPVLRGGTV